MQADKKILDEIIKLQALHAEGLDRATTLRELLEGEQTASPKTLRRKGIVAEAVNGRNLRIRNKQQHVK